MKHSISMPFGRVSFVSGVELKVQLLEIDALLVLKLRLFLEPALAILGFLGYAGLKHNLSTQAGEISWSPFFRIIFPAD